MSVKKDNCDHIQFKKNPKMRGGGGESMAVWNFSKNSSHLVAGSFPLVGRGGAKWWGASIRPFTSNNFDDRDFFYKQQHTQTSATKHKTSFEINKEFNTSIMLQPAPLSLLHSYSANSRLPPNLQNFTANLSWYNRSQNIQSGIQAVQN